jgi:hypothetical protein
MIDQQDTEQLSNECLFDVINRIDKDSTSNTLPDDITLGDFLTWIDSTRDHQSLSD